MSRNQWKFSGILIIMATLIAFTLLKNSSTSTIRLSARLPQNILFTQLERQYANYTKINLVGPVKDLRQYKVIVISYNDFSGTHYVNYHLVKEFKN